MGGVRKTDGQAWQCCRVHSEHTCPQMTRGQQVITLHLRETKARVSGQAPQALPIPTHCPHPQRGSGFCLDRLVHSGEKPGACTLTAL